MRPTAAEIVPEPLERRDDKTQDDVDNRILFRDYTNDDDDDDEFSSYVRSKINQPTEDESLSTIADQELCSDEEISLWDFFSSKENIELIKFYDKYGYDHEPHELDDDGISLLPIDCGGPETSDQNENDANQQHVAIWKYKIEQFAEAMRLEEVDENDRDQCLDDSVIDESISTLSLQQTTQHTQHTLDRLNSMLKYLQEK